MKIEFKGPRVEMEPIAVSDGVCLWVKEWDTGKIVRIDGNRQVSKSVYETLESVSNHNSNAIMIFKGDTITITF